MDTNNETAINKGPCSMGLFYGRSFGHEQMGSTVFVVVLCHGKTCSQENQRRAY